MCVPSQRDLRLLVLRQAKAEAKVAKAAVDSAAMAAAAADGFEVPEEPDSKPLKAPKAPKASKAGKAGKPVDAEGNEIKASQVSPRYMGHRGSPALHAHDVLGCSGPACLLPRMPTSTSARRSGLVSKKSSRLPGASKRLPPSPSLPYISTYLPT